MNASLKAVEGCRTNILQLRAALFHSTPVLERRRRNHWQPKSTNSRRPWKQQWKRNVLRNFNTYADDFFQSWIPFTEEDDQRNRGPSWFRGQPGGSGSRKHGNPNRSQKARGRRGFDFCDDDLDAETIFRAAFGGGERISFWSFVNEDTGHWRSSSGYTKGQKGSSWHGRFYHSDEDDEEEDDSRSDTSQSTSSSDRLALGLSPHGPLKLDDVKHAYRTCALKYHPDRHQGPSKNNAEERFKLCTAAYQSLCDKLAVN